MPLPEVRRSFGRGGYGNIRTPSEAIIEQKVILNEDGSVRRRSSVWSTHTHKKSSLIHRLLRRSSRDDDSTDDAGSISTDQLSETTSRLSEPKSDSE